MTAVHNHLVREVFACTQVALIIESGEPREVMHLRAADRVWRRHGGEIRILPSRRWKILALRDGMPAGAGIAFEKAIYHYIKSVNKGLLKSLLEDGHFHAAELSRRARVFEAIGLNKSLIDRYFTGTASRIRRRRPRRAGA